MDARMDATEFSIEHDIELAGLETNYLFDLDANDGDITIVFDESIEIIELDSPQTNSSETSLISNSSPKSPVTPADLSTPLHTNPPNNSSIIIIDLDSDDENSSGYRSNNNCSSPFYEPELSTPKKLSNSKRCKSPMKTLPMFNTPPRKTLSSPDFNRSFSPIYDPEFPFFTQKTPSRPKRKLVNESVLTSPFQKPPKKQFLSPSTLSPVNNTRKKSVPCKLNPYGGNFVGATLEETSPAIETSNFGCQALLHEERQLSLYALRKQYGKGLYMLQKHGYGQPLEDKGIPLGQPLKNKGIPLPINGKK